MTLFPDALGAKCVSKVLFRSQNKQNKTDFTIKWSIIKNLFLTREDLKDVIYV